MCTEIGLEKCVVSCKDYIIIVVFVVKSLYLKYFPRSYSPNRLCIKSIARVKVIFISSGPEEFGKTEAQKSLSMSFLSFATISTTLLSLQLHTVRSLPVVVFMKF